MSDTMYSAYSHEHNESQGPGGVWHAHFVASFNTRTSPVSGRATECANVTMLVPAVEYVQSAWFKERFLVLNLAQDMFDKPSALCSSILNDTINSMRDGPRRRSLTHNHSAAALMAHHSLPVMASPIITGVSPAPAPSPTPQPVDTNVQNAASAMDDVDAADSMDSAGAVAARSPSCGTSTRSPTARMHAQGYSHLDLDAMVQVAEGRVWATVVRLPPSASAFATAFRPWAALVQAKAMGAVLAGGVGAGAGPGPGAGVVGWRVQEDLRMSPPVPLPLRHVVPQAL